MEKIYSRLEHIIQTSPGKNDNFHLIIYLPDLLYGIRTFIA